MEYVPYFIALGLLLFAFIIIAKVQRTLFGIVVALMPAVAISVDVFIDGNLTFVRMVFNIFYACMLIYAVTYNIRKRGV